MNLIQKNRENGFLTPNRYLEFGNAIREKYAQGEGYGGASLLYAQEPVAAKPQESGTSS